MYDILKPEVEQDYYIYVDHTFHEDVRTIQSEELFDYIELTVIPTDEDFYVIGEEKKIHFKLDDVVDISSQITRNDTIVITRATQLLGKEQITVAQYNPTLFYNITSLN